MSAISYNPEIHEYRDNGRVVPGLTAVLSDLGYYRGKQFYTNKSRWRGTALHQATHLVDQHCPDAEFLDDVLDVIDLSHPEKEKEEWLRACVTGYLLAKREIGLTPERREFQVYSRRLRVAGTIDLWGHGVLVDLKTWKDAPPKCQRSAEIQVAGYDIMAEEDLGLKTERRYVLALTGSYTKPYRLYLCDGPNDKLVAQSLMVTWHDKSQHGLLEAA